MATDLRASASLVIAGLAADGETSWIVSITSIADTNVSKKSCNRWAPISSPVRVVPMKRVTMWVFE